jgi:hypothetical protein
MRLIIYIFNITLYLDKHKRFKYPPDGGYLFANLVILYAVGVTQVLHTVPAPTPRPAAPVPT